MLIQQLIKLSEATDQKFVLALKSGKTRKLKGYFVADDEDVTSNASAALDFSSKAEARDCAAECNRSWDLEDGDSFDVIKLEDAKKMNEERLDERYDSSSDFDSDMDKIQSALETAQKIAKSANFTKHMKDTDQNFDTSTAEMGRRALDKLQLAIEAYEKFYTEMERAA